MKYFTFIFLCLLTAGCRSYPPVHESFVSGEDLTKQFHAAISRATVVEVEAVFPSESPQSNVVARITSPDRIATLREPDPGEWRIRQGLAERLELRELRTTNSSRRRPDGRTGGVAFVTEMKATGAA
jgi:hypothetical protein